MLRQITPCLLAALGVAAPPPDASHGRMEVRVVEDGRFVEGLKWSDFVLKRQTQPLQVVNVSVEREPLDLVLVVDRAASMSPWLDFLDVNAELAISLLGQHDRVAVVSAVDKTSTRAPLSVDADIALNAIGKIITQREPDSNVSLAAAIRHAAEYLQQSARPLARPVILVLSNNSRHAGGDEKECLTAVARTRAIVSLMLLPSLDSTVKHFAENSKEHGDIVPFVQATGGVLMDSRLMGDVMKHGLEALRTRYLVQYREETRGAPEQRISVSLSDIAWKVHPRATIRAKPIVDKN